MLTPAQLQRAKELFFDLCDLPAEQQQLRLADGGGDDPDVKFEVERLLRADEGPDASASAPDGQGGGPFERPLLAQLSAGAESDAQALPTGAIIGGYRIVRLIGEGGAGAVYEAEQAAPHRRVALKLIRAGAVSRSAMRRFQLEGEVLGQLQHPGIARIYEAGTAQLPNALGPGRWPFLSMELIDGPVLTEWARQRRLSVHERLELLARACDAMQHAHQKGVIHRDLKPANILVEPGADRIGLPKVLDFGVSRATNGAMRGTTIQTGIGQIVGTLAYMSPEQVAGDPAAIDTRCDVYALAVILYELLTGTLPIVVRDCPVPEAMRRIAERPPTPLSAHDPSLHGDLATIVAKGLAKDRARRYASAADLADDLRRFMRHELILARPATTLYVLRRLARRHRALAITGGVAALGIVGGLIGTTTFALRAGQRARDSERRVALAGEGADLLFDRVIRELPNIAGSNRLQRDVLAAATRHYERLAAERPGGLEELRRIWLSFEYLSEAYRELSDYPAAGSAARRFFELASRAAQDNPDDRRIGFDLMRAHAQLAYAKVETGRNDWNIATEIGERLLRQDPANLELLLALARHSIRSVTGAWDKDHRRADRLAGRLLQIAPDDPRVLRLKVQSNDHAGNALEETDPHACRSLRAESVALLRRLSAIQPASAQHRRGLCILLTKLAFIERTLGDLNSAEREAREALRLVDELIRVQPDVLSLRGMRSEIFDELVPVARAQGRMDEVCAFAEESLREWITFTGVEPTPYSFGGVQGRLSAALEACPPVSSNEILAAVLPELVNMADSLDGPGQDAFLFAMGYWAENARISSPRQRDALHTVFRTLQQSVRWKEPAQAVRRLSDIEACLDPAEPG